MVKEIDQHNKRKNWILVKRIDIPSHFNILPSVWAMRRKRDLSTGEITKWKARLNVDGSKQQYGIDYSNMNSEERNKIKTFIFFKVNLAQTTAIADRCVSHGVC